MRNLVNANMPENLPVDVQGAGAWCGVVPSRGAHTGTSRPGFSLSVSRLPALANIGIYFNKLGKSGHFAAWKRPELFTQKLRAAFRSLR